MIRKASTTSRTSAVRGSSWFWQPKGFPWATTHASFWRTRGSPIAALANVVSNEDDVKGVVQKVALGEADAGIVYRTDVTPAVADDLQVVEVPDNINVVAVYPIAAIGSGAEDLTGSEFVAYVLGPGQSALRAAGFLPP